MCIAITGIHVSSCSIIVFLQCTNSAENNVDPPAPHSRTRESGASRLHTILTDDGSIIKALPAMNPVAVVASIFWLYFCQQDFLSLCLVFWSVLLYPNFRRGEKSILCIWFFSVLTLKTNSVNVSSIAKVSRQGGNCPKDCWIETGDRHYQMALGAMYSQPLLESMIYVATRPRIVVLACSTTLRRVALFDLLWLRPFNAAVSCALSALVKTAREVIREIQASPLTWNVVRDEGELVCLYLQSHIRDRTETPYTSQGIDYLLKTLDEI